MADLQKRLTHTVTHTRKRADGSSGNRDVEEYFNSSENDQKRPENDIFRFFLLFVISRSGVRVRLLAPIFPQRSKVNMGEFPSGQRGQTVNLLSVTSVVRIHLPPPLSSRHLCLLDNFLYLRIRKPALGGMPVACRNRRGFSAEKRIHLPPPGTS